MASDHSFHPSHSISYLMFSLQTLIATGLSDLTCPDGWLLAEDSGLNSGRQTLLSFHFYFKLRMAEELSWRSQFVQKLRVSRAWSPATRWSPKPEICSLVVLHSSKASLLLQTISVLHLNSLLD
jgi:hypothetical protein